MRTTQIILGLVLAIPLAFSAHAAKYKEAEVSNGGAVQGTITYNGAVKNRTVLPTKDKEVCGKARKVPQIIVGGGGGVAEAVVFISGIDSGKPWPDMGRPVINQEGCIFEPHVQVARRGKVDIVNSDPVLHNTHGYYGKATAFNVALPIKDAKVTKILRKTGELKIDCDAHGWMLGWVYVVENPYFMQTGEDGKFMIDNIPPGDYTMSIWQETLGLTEVAISVGGGETATVDVELK